MKMETKATLIALAIIFGIGGFYELTHKENDTLSTGVGYCVAAAKSNYERRTYADDEKTAKMVEQSAISDCTRLYGN